MIKALDEHIYLLPVSLLMILDLLLWLSLGSDERSAPPPPVPGIVGEAALASGTVAARYTLLCPSPSLKFSLL
jgi:hypothetical protein